MNVKKLFACLLLSFAAVTLFGCGMAEEVPQETTTVSQTEIVSDSGDTETEAVTEAELSADDFEYKETENGIEIQKYIGSGAEVKIPGEIDGKPVVKIGGWAFRFREDIVSVQIPDSVTEIGFSAFDGCTCLENAYLPESLVKIEDYAFDMCSSLRLDELPDNVK